MIITLSSVPIPPQPRHLGNEITQQRVDAVTEAYLELMQQSLRTPIIGQIETAPSEQRFWMRLKRPRGGPLWRKG